MFWQNFGFGSGVLGYSNIFTFKFHVVMEQSKKFGTFTVDTDTTVAEIDASAKMNAPQKAEAKKFLTELHKLSKMADFKPGDSFKGEIPWDALKMVGVGVGSKLPVDAETFNALHTDADNQPGSFTDNGKTVRFVKLNGVCATLFGLKAAILPDGQNIKFIQGKCIVEKLAAYPVNVSAKALDILGNEATTAPDVNQPCEIFLFEDAYTPGKFRTLLAA